LCEIDFFEINKICNKKALIVKNAKQNLKITLILAR